MDRIAHHTRTEEAIPPDDDLDLYARLAHRPPILTGVRARTVTLAMMLQVFDEWIRALIQAPGVETYVAPELFPVIEHAGTVYRLSPAIDRETSSIDPLWRPNYVALPPVPSDWHRYHLKAAVQSSRLPTWWYQSTPAPADTGTNQGIFTYIGNVCFFVLRPSGTGGLIGSVVYLDVIEPWIEALRQDAGERWQEEEANSHEGTPTPEVYIPQKPAVLARWKAIWRAVRPYQHLPMAGRNNDAGGYLINKLPHHLKCDAKTLAKVLKAGRAGALD